MSISYNLNIPASTHNPSNDQPNMLINTNAINQLIGIDHVSFNSSGIDVSGQHLQVTFNDVTTQSTPTTPKSVLYTKNDAVNIAQLNFLNSTGFANQPFQSGCVLLFGGVIMQWGRSAVIGSNVNFAATFPNAAFSMVVTGSSTLYSGGFVVSALSTTGFTVERTSGSGNTGYYYIAIGN